MFRLISIARLFAKSPLAQSLKLRLADRGQTATEYLGVLILVAVIIVGLITTGVGEMIFSAIQDAVSSVITSGNESGVNIEPNIPEGDGGDGGDGDD